MSQIESKPLYKLGRTVFSLSHADSAFEQVLEELLSTCEEKNPSGCAIYDVRFGWSPNTNELFKQLVDRHDDCLQIRATCLISGRGQKVLISGAVDSGKTTMALALIFAHGWKSLSDYAALLDRQENKILSFAAPFHTKSGTRALLETFDVTLPPFILHDYVPVKKENRAEDCEGQFDLAIHLEGKGDTALSCSSITSFQYLRKVMPASNLAKLRDDPERFLTYLKDNACYQFIGGSVKERVEKILELCGIG